MRVQATHSKNAIMQKTIIFIATALTFMSCSQAAISNKEKQQDQPKNDAVHQIEESSGHSQGLTLSDAQKILGEPAHLKDSTPTIKGAVAIYAYVANSIDSKTGKTGSLYFTCERWDQVAPAKSKYAATKAANEAQGIQVLDTLGDEAYFHTDGTAFYFIMVRKGARLFNIKVNKITSNTSLDEFHRIAKKIADSL
jgi:hypothetical protein